MRYPILFCSNSRHLSFALSLSERVSFLSSDVVKFDLSYALLQKFMSLFLIVVGIKIDTSPPCLIILELSCIKSP